MKLLNLLNNNVPAIAKLKEAVWSTGVENGGVMHDLFGRRLVYPNLDFDHALKEAKQRIKEDVEGKLFTSNPKQLARVFQSRAQRQVFNGVLQGTAATILKIITLQCFKDRDTLGLAMKFAAPVHDELQTYVREDHTAQAKAMLEKNFSLELLTHCPIEGEAESGKNWAQTH